MFMNTKSVSLNISYKQGNLRRNVPPPASQGECVLVFYGRNGLTFISQYLLVNFLSTLVCVCGKCSESMKLKHEIIVTYMATFPRKTMGVFPRNTTKETFPRKTKESFPRQTKFSEKDKGTTCYYTRLHCLDNLWRQTLPHSRTD